MNSESAGNWTGGPDSRCTLETLFSERRILICVGSGGVGKTTTAATMAMLSALRGRKVLALTIDPARRLADALGLAALGHDIQQVPDAKLDEVAKRRGVPRVPGGQLYAMMLDQKRAFDEVVDRYSKDPALKGRILKNAIYQQISASLAGSHEYAAMSKLYDLARGNTPWDLIVLDTPPTQNALDFLDAPDRISAAVDSPAIEWFIKPYLQQAGSLGLRLFGMGGAFVLRGLARFVGSAFLQQMAEFFVEFGAVTAGFRERASEVRALLRRPEVAFVLVCSPEPLPVEEALYLHDRLVKAAMPLGAIVVNRVNVAGPQLGTELAAKLLPQLEARPELRGFLAEDLTRLAADLGRTYAEQQVVAAADERAIAELRTKARPGGHRCPVCPVPMFEQDIHDTAGIALVSLHLAPP